MRFSILCIIHDIISEIGFLLADIMWRGALAIVGWRGKAGGALKENGLELVLVLVLTDVRISEELASKKTHFSFSLLLFLGLF